MSYDRKIEYKMILTGTFEIMTNCAGCKGKARFVSTNCFRVNANGSMLDVWLIYQCKKCRHTLNLPIYERKKVSAVPEWEYQRFMENNLELAEEYGRKKELFAKNKMEIAWDAVGYQYVDLQGDVLVGECNYSRGDVIVVENEYGVKVRPERMAADILGCSRDGVRRMIEKGEVLVEVRRGEVEIRIL